MDFYDCSGSWICASDPTDSVICSITILFGLTLSISAMYTLELWLQFPYLRVPY